MQSIMDIHFLCVCCSQGYFSYISYICPWSTFIYPNLNNLSWNYHLLLLVGHMSSASDLILKSASKNIKFGGEKLLQKRLWKKILETSAAADMSDSTFTSSSGSSHQHWFFSFSDKSLSKPILMCQDTDYKFYNYGDIEPSLINIIIDS